jgi:alkylhydroperoxidase family enzyme
VEGLHNAGFDEEKVAALQSDFESGGFSEQELAFLRLAEQLTLYPESSANATRAACEVGWSNEEVAQAIFVISYYNMVTRIADAFALPPDDNHPYDPGAPLPMLRCSDN